MGYGLRSVETHPWRPVDLFARVRCPELSLREGSSKGVRKLWKYCQGPSETRGRRVEAGDNLPVPLAGNLVSPSAQMMSVTSESKARAYVTMWGIMAKVGGLSRAAGPLYS